jgi:hypothetical protein
MSDPSTPANSGEEKKRAKKKARAKKPKPKPKPKETDSPFDLPPIPEEAKTAAEPEAEPLEVIPEGEAELAGATSLQFTIIAGDGDEYGPRSLEDVQRWIRTGRANACTLVRTRPDARWQPLGQIPELAPLLEGTGLAVRRPGRVTAIAGMTLAGGLIALAWPVVMGFASGGIFLCCLFPCLLYSLVSGILITIQGVKLLGRNAAAALPRTDTAATLQICGVFACNPIGLILGILTHVFLRNDAVIDHLQKTSGGK